MWNDIEKWVKQIAGSVVFLAITAVFATVIGARPEIPVALFAGTIALLTLSAVIHYSKVRGRLYKKSFVDEKTSYPLLRSKISKVSKYEVLRVCGASCTSIFALFEEYVNAIANGKSIYVCILNPDAHNIIEYLDDCESDKAEVVKKVRQDIINLEDEIDDNVLEILKTLSFSNESYGRNIIEASLLLWFEAHKVANNKASGTLTNGLSVYLYTHIPNLKAWIFGDTDLFIGGYGPMPGGAGINNPIYYITGRSSEKIKDSRRTFHFLATNESTIKVQREQVLKMIAQSNGFE